jgi:hypothetical protein
MVRKLEGKIAVVTDHAVMSVENGGLFGGRYPLGFGQIVGARCEKLFPMVEAPSASLRRVHRDDRLFSAADYVLSAESN